MEDAVFAFAISFCVVFVAELGDKSQLMALAFATRYRALPVLAGVTAATAVVHAVSVAVGFGLGTSVPPGWASLVAAAAFLGFGAWTLRGDALTPAEEEKARRGGRSAVVAASVAFFFAELGDKTMLATITLATRHGWFGVWLGSTAGMVLADALAIWVGRSLGRRLDERVIRPVAAALFVAFGIALADTAAAQLTGTSLLGRVQQVLGERSGAWLATALAVLTVAAVWYTRKRALGRGLWPSRPAALGSPRWWVRILFGAAVLLGIAGPLLVAVGLLAPVEVVGVPGLVTVGACLLLLGVTVLLVAQVQVGSVRRSAATDRVGTGGSTENAAATDGRPLATGGIFSRVRNPAFTGMVVAAAGMLVLVPTALSVLSTIVMITAAQVHVRAVREPVLARLHGAGYAGYADRAGRFLPRIR